MYDAPLKQHGIPLSDFDLKRFRSARVGSMELHHAKHPTLPDTNAFAVLGDDGSYIAYLVALDITDFPDSKPTVQVKRTWVEPPHRGRGVMTTLINTLVRQGFRVLSDVEMSRDAEAMWKKLASSRGVEIFNPETLETTPFNARVFDGGGSVLMIEGYVLFNNPRNAPNNDVLLDFPTYIGQDCP